MTFSSPEFWVALLQIIGVNIVLSGDNAVVIALAARSLPPHQQRKAVAWGSGAAVVMRVVLTIVAVQLLKLPVLKLVGALLLLWIALQLLMPEDDGGDDGNASSNLMTAIRTILVADLVMSLDNVIAVAAAAKGNVTLLIIGLAVSIPLVIFASTLLLTLMARFPFIITAGAALLGWVAGEMAITDPLVKDWIDANMPYLHYLAPAAGAVLVVVLGKWLARRAEAARETAEHAAHPPAAVPAGPHAKRVLVGVDGTEQGLRAVRHALALQADRSQGEIGELHLVNVQPPMPGAVSSHVSGRALHEFHDQLSREAFQPAKALVDAQQLPCHMHAVVGEAGHAIAELAHQIGADLVVMGSRGLGAGAAALVGSVAQRTLEQAQVPVLVVH
jgi:YjbE family integral membrane protein